MENGISSLFKEKSKSISDTDIAPRHIGSLEFASPTVRRAFDRYLSIRNELHSCDGRPVSVNDIFNTANLYNRRREYSHACPAPELEPVIIGSGGAYNIFTAKSPLRMPCAGDMIMAFLGVTPELVSLILSQNYIKLFFPSELCPIDLISRMRFGAWLDLTVLCDYLKTDAEDFLVNPMPGMYIAVIDGKFSQMRAVKLSGLCEYSAFVGKVIAEPRIYLSCDGRAVLDEAPSPYPGDALCCSLPEYGTEETGISRKERRFKSDISELAFVSSDVMPFASPFCQSYYCVSTLVCRLAAEGMPYEGARLFCNIGMSPAEKDGDALERALGIFAASVDLNVYVKKCESFFTSSPCCVLSVFCPEQPSSDEFYFTDGEPYLLSPYKTEDGLPDTDDLMKMLLYITKLREDGTIIHAYEIADLLSDAKPDVKASSYPVCSVIAFSTRVIQGIPLNDAGEDSDDEGI